MFGCPLEEHLRLFKTEVSVVLEACCQALTEQWMDTEGLFRIAAGTARVRLLKVRMLPLVTRSLVPRPHPAFQC